MEIQILNWQTLDADAKIQALKRPANRLAESMRKGVRELIDDVKQHGDEALLRLTERFDGVKLDQIEVSQEEFIVAEKLVDTATIRAMERAIHNLTRFHEKQQSTGYEIEISSGIRCFRQPRPIDRVGLYAPGGTAPLPSTVLMLAVPANIAACPLKILCTPPNQQGTVNPHILMAAKLAGVTQVYKVGGVQAIAAMAFGTATIPKVDKIFGPGNSWVTEAKLQVAQDPEGASYDMPAGPSEVLVIADQNANEAFIAADLLSQAEHGTDSQSILLTTNERLAQKVIQELTKQASQRSRKLILEESIKQIRIILCNDLSECFDLSNEYGPEHLIVQTTTPEQWVPMIRNAGSVFLGQWSPESIGDYASGTNHVLPTYGYAKSISGLSVDSFLKQITFQQLTAEGLMDLGPVVEKLADLEGLDAHRHAVSLRLARIKEGNLT